MATPGLLFDSLAPAWQELWRKLMPPTPTAICPHARGLWPRLRGRPAGVRIGTSWFCLDRCLEGALSESFLQSPPVPRRTVPSRRIPLGLMLLARDELNAEQLHAALAAQRAAGHGRIGEWLRRLGYASEEQITAALARQWACPVVRAEAWPAPSARPPRLPFTLLESFLMVPVAYVEATRTLHLAFCEGIDYGVLYAVEQMLACRTEACLGPASLIRQKLQTLAPQHRESEASIDRVADAAEFARIVRSYCFRLRAHDLRLVHCGSRIWVRLIRPACEPLDLLLRLPAEAFLPPIVRAFPKPVLTV
jgi:hypothetical protein